jgi:hypothetical protein
VTQQPVPPFIRAAGKNSPTTWAMLGMLLIVARDWRLAVMAAVCLVAGLKRFRLK